MPPPSSTSKLGGPIKAIKNEFIAFSTIKYLAHIRLKTMEKMYFILARNLNCNLSLTAKENCFLYFQFFAPNITIKTESTSHEIAKRTQSYFISPSYLGHFM